MSLPNDYDLDKTRGMQGMPLSMYFSSKGAMREGSLRDLTGSLEAITIKEATAPMAIANSKKATHTCVRASLSIEEQFVTSSAGHSKSFVDKRIALYKTEMCRAFEETGSCRYGSRCQFAHSQGELRKVPRHPRYKTEICKTYWEVGSCPYGKRCCFIHNESDLVGSSHDPSSGSLLGTSAGDLSTAALTVQLGPLKKSTRLIYERTLQGKCNDELCEDHLWEEEAVSGQISRDLLKLLDD